MFVRNRKLRERIRQGEFDGVFFSRGRIFRNNEDEPYILSGKDFAKAKSYVSNKTGEKLVSVGYISYNGRAFSLEYALEGEPAPKYVQLGAGNAVIVEPV